MVSSGRARKIADRIREELADILQREIADPRLAMVTVTGVEVDRELAYATIYIVATGEEERAEEVLQGLRSAQGFLRRELARRISLRHFPQLRFRWDDSLARAARIEELLDQLHQETGGEEDEIQ
ncbi:MAG TPA: 30S ribosome-binding factor RbfA [Chloroflexi bacterium]|nr:30S ribosome-binding factor RbfA [Chloroflexota bacterium]